MKKKDFAGNIHMRIMHNSVDNSLSESN